MEKHLSEKKRFSIVARARSFAHAFRGLKLMWDTQPNIKIQAVIGILMVLLGFAYDISHMEWVTLVGAMFMVLVAEAFNTAFEFDIDLTSPNYHPYARDTKDVAAGAVLIATFAAIIVGLIIFVPKIFMA